MNWQRSTFDSGAEAAYRAELEPLFATTPSQLFLQLMLYAGRVRRIVAACTSTTSCQGSCLI